MHRERLDPVEDRLGDLVLRRERHLVLAVALDDRDLVVGRSRSRSPTRETSLKTIASAPLRSSFARARSIASAPVSAANPTSVCSSRRRGADAGEDVLGRLQTQLERRRPRGRSSASALSAARKSAGAAAISSTSASAKRRVGRRRRAPRWSRPRHRARCRPAAAGLTLAAISVTSAPRRAAAVGERDPHPPARAVADEADRVDRLAGPAGGDQHAQPVPAPSRDRAAQSRPRRAGAPGSGSRPMPCSPREASGPESGSITDHAPVAQRAQVRLSRRVGVHPVVHRRGDQPRRRAGAETRWSASSRRFRRRAWRACSPMPGATRHRVGVLTRARGGRSGRGRAARRRDSRRASGRARTRRPAPGRRRSPRTTRRRRSAAALRVMTTRTPWPAVVASRASSSAL